ncbi:MAG: TolC family protein, partial [Pseudomonadales bacterium]|nr:TolC family protein [Pseudomonadales bacterium]
YAISSQQLQLLRDESARWRERYDRSSAAMSQGDVTFDQNATDLVALVDVSNQLHQAEQTFNEVRHDLNLLLGLAPYAQVEITPPGLPEPVPADSATTKLSDIAERRPDLMALKAGYVEQEARVRAAVLNQVPSIGLSLNRSRDTSDVRTNGLGVSLTLPFLNGSRGDIAIERASREQLRAEYVARLSHAGSDIDKLLSLQSLIGNQLVVDRKYLDQLSALRDQARAAYDRGDLAPTAFLNVEQTWVSNRMAWLSLIESAWQNRIALDTLLAVPGGTSK